MGVGCIEGHYNRLDDPTQRQALERTEDVKGLHQMTPSVPASLPDRAAYQKPPSACTQATAAVDEGGVCVADVVGPDTSLAIGVTPSLAIGVTPSTVFSA